MKADKKYIKDLLKDFFENKKLVKAVFSNMKGNYPYTKINIKPVVIKNNFFFQFEQFQNNKAYHSNLDISESSEKFDEIIDNFKQYMIFTTEGDYQILKGKNDFNVKVTKNCREIKSFEHN